MAALLRSRIDSVLAEAVASGRVPGLVAAVTDRDDLIYEAAFGFAQTKAGLRMQPDSVFRIASMTKIVTTLAVMLLHDEGLIELDAPFERYFKEFRQPGVLESFDAGSRAYTTRPARRRITVRDLLTHTSGYGYWFLNAELRDLMTGAVEYYNPPFLIHEPGTRFAYGIGTDVLGQAIGPVTGLALEELFEQRLLGPLGMRDTSFALPREPARLASLHAGTPHGFVELPNEGVAEAPRGGGGLYSTARDYLALLRLLLNDGRCGDGVRLLRAESVREIVRNQVGELPVERQRTAAPERTDDFRFMDDSQTFGLGVLIETRDRPGRRSAGSYGWAGIFNTYFWVDARIGIGAVVLMQTSPFSAADCIEVCDRFETSVYAELRATA